MGTFFSLFKGLLNNQVDNDKEIRILTLGLDNSGKTTLLKQLGLKKLYTKQQKMIDKNEGEEITEENIESTIPTIGYNVKEVKFKSLTFSVFDLGGQVKLRELWKHYYLDTKAIVYVVDAVDKDRINESKLQLEKVLKNEELVGVPLLIFANKSDLKNCLNHLQIMHKFDIKNNIKNGERDWFVQSCSALKGFGVTEGFEWLISKMS